jgi:RNA polymerase sigma-70 factor (ECF subfamily)
MTSERRALLQERFAAGDDRAFAEWVRRLRHRLIAHARRFAGAHDAEDVVQTALVEAWRGRAGYDPSRPIEPWLLTIVRRRALDAVRRRPAGGSPPPTDDLVAPAGGVEPLAELLDLRPEHAALPAPQREAVALAYYGGLTQTEVAGSLGVPVGTVKTRTARGLRRLAAALAANGYPGALPGA